MLSRGGHWSTLETLLKSTPRQEAKSRNSVANEQNEGDLAPYVEKKDQHPLDVTDINGNTPLHFGNVYVFILT